MRTGEVHRHTGETDVKVKLDLDGIGRCEASTGVPFLDHMLHQISSHGLIDLTITAVGDTHIDDHHTNEDVGIAVGQALSQALGDRKGIYRFGHFVAPLDEALVQVALDCSGRPHISYGLTIPTQKIGTYDTELVKEFFVAVANNSGLTLHLRQLDGVNSITSSRLVLRLLPVRCAWPPKSIPVALVRFQVARVSSSRPAQTDA